MESKCSIHANCYLLRWPPSFMVSVQNRTSMQGVFLWSEYLPIACDSDKAYLPQQTDHLMAFVSSQDIKLNSSHVRYTFTGIIQLDVLKGKRQAVPSLFYKGRSTGSKRLHHLCQATQLASVSVRIWVQDIEFPWQWSLHFPGLLFYMPASCLWLWLINIVHYILVIAKRARLICKVSQTCSKHDFRCLFITLISASQSKPMNQDSQRRVPVICVFNQHPWWVSWSG